MWIRSQNKENLIDAKYVVIESYVDGRHHISNNGFILGTYSRKEKAMSVLDDLQCRIARTETGVFPMPEDDND